MNLRFFNQSSWDIRGVAPPWGDRPSIYKHIAAHLHPGNPSHYEVSEMLPDEDYVRGETGFGWAPGALDGAFGHHGDGGNSAEMARAILSVLRALTEKATNDRAEALYSLLTQHATLDYIDPLLEAIIQDRKINRGRVHAVARWLATEAPDREPVKTAIAIISILQGGEDRDLLLTLGRHEEFTLYAAVALQNIGDNPERTLWELGKHVTGWGRIQIVERLAGTQDEQIKAWMLREGYRNDIMYEYTALICARTGDLLGALRLAEPDDQLLKGAGAILSTLIRGRGGPAEGVEAYSEGAEAAELYLRHIQAREPDLEDLVAIAEIERFLEEEGGEAHDMALGWPQRRAILLDHISAIRWRPYWEEKVHKGLTAEDQQIFWTAAEAAKVLGMDTWDVYFERVQRGEDHWYFIMQTDQPDRIDRVVQLAEERLPLEEIASGPADELGLGPEFQPYTALDFVLQDLRRFPGKGWTLIRAGLQSPVTRNRNMAARALASWGREDWPDEAEVLLRRALKAEPNADTRESMRKVLASEALEF